MKDYRTLLAGLGALATLGVGGCETTDVAAMMGAVGGMAVAGAYGGDTTMMIEGASLGASLTGGGSSVAQALSSVSSQTSAGGLGATGAPMAPTGQSSAGGGRGSTTPGSYPTQDHWLESGDACQGFTRSNYRQYALSGGNDTQLKTMCGQAYELYSMYERAIAQGYSEAEANRTYRAYNEAAQNASTFYANNRARNGSGF